jgi:hypothetical protein
MGVVAISLGLGGCGGGDDGSDADLERGKQVFAEAGCDGCHTLADAGASGKVGPDLDSVAPDYETVLEQVTDGGPGMPAFEGELSEEEIEAVSAYVSEAAGGGLTAAVTFEPDDTELSECHGPESYPCFEQAFANLVYEEGPQVAIAALADRLESNGSIAANCHRIAHAMGSAALVRFEDDVSTAFAEGDSICSSGYYHGILERAFSGVPEDELGETAATLCAGEGVADDPFLAFQCRHGLGHGLMIETRYDLPLALDTCEALGETLRTTCQDGVFMENFTSSYGIQSEYVRANDLIYPCNDVAEERKYSCYIIVTARILPELDYDWRKTADACRDSEPDWMWVCFRSYGRDAISMNAYDQDTARRLCHHTEEWETECVLSVALHIANEEGDVDGAGRFCRETPAGLRPYCYTGLGITMSLLYPNPSRRKEICAGLTERESDFISCSTGIVSPA